MEGIANSIVVSIPVITLLVEKTKREHLPRLLLCYLVFAVSMIAAEIFLLFGIAWWTMVIVGLVAMLQTAGFFLALSRIP